MLHDLFEIKLDFRRNEKIVEKILISADLDLVSPDVFAQSILYRFRLAIEEQMEELLSIGNLDMRCIILSLRVHIHII